MTHIKRPLLAAQENPQKFPEFFKKLPYPLLLSPKLDGIRGVVGKDAVYSRTMLELPSRQVQELFCKEDFFGLDGELIEGNPREGEIVYNRTQSHVMSIDKPGDIGFYVFDDTSPEIIGKPFYLRLEHVEYRVASLKKKYGDLIHFVEHDDVDTERELFTFEHNALEEGFEGIMMRGPVGAYKQGRATFSQGILYKLKRFTDDEALIIGFEPAYKNTNALQRDIRGYAKRSKTLDNREPYARVGKFICLYNNEEIRVSSGAFKHHELEEIWANQGMYIGKWLKFRYFGYGMKDLPRQLRAIGFRHKMDM